MVPVDSDKISRVPPYSGYTKEVSWFRIRGFHPFQPNFPKCSAIKKLCNSVYSVLQPQSKDWFGLFPFRSPLLRKSIFLSFPPVTKMFQFPGLPPLELWIHSRVLAVASGFPHSEISGSKHTYCSPKHIAVCRVLHRLLMPRHPLCALINLTTIIFLIWWVMRS